MKYFFRFKNKDLTKTLILLSKDLIDKEGNGFTFWDSYITKLQFKERDLFVEPSLNILGKILNRRKKVSEECKFAEMAVNKTIELQERIRKHFNVSFRSKGVRYIIRVDDFPRWDIPSNEYRKFHQIISLHNIPYLLGVTPFLSNEPLNPMCNTTQRLTQDEIDFLHTATKDGVKIALHGFTHKAIHKNCPSEIVGLNNEDLDKKIRISLDEFKQNGFTTDVFVPPFNTFDYRSIDVLKNYFSIVCGGPESIRYVGFRLTLSYIDGCLYIPSYPLVYGKAKQICEFVDKMSTVQESIIVPITLHWAWERGNGFEDVKMLCREIEGNVLEWKELVKWQNAYD